MAPKLSVLLLILSVVTVTVMAQRRRTSSSSTTTNTDEWNYRDGSEKVNMRGVANLTQILDNWSLSCLTTPDDLYKEFNALKAHLGDLTDKFSAIETFIDEVKADRANKPTLARPLVQLRPRPQTGWEEDAEEEGLFL
ncbi:hypothetical protein FQN60_005314, partial [Etheostoma spectabile]